MEFWCRDAVQAIGLCECILWLFVQTQEAFPATYSMFHDIHFEASICCEMCFRDRHFISSTKIGALSDCAENLSIRFQRFYMVQSEIRIPEALQETPFVNGKF